MSVIKVTFQAFLFYHPALKWAFLLGIAGIVLGVMMQMGLTATNSWAVGLRFGGFVFACFVPALPSGHILRQCLSNRHLQLAPRTKVYALFAFMLINLMCFALFCIAILPEIILVQKAPVVQMLVGGALLFSIVPWLVFWLAKFRAGYVIAWFIFFVSAEWLSEYYKAVIKIAANYNESSIVFIILLWASAIGLCMRTKFIARVAPLHTAATKNAKPFRSIISTLLPVQIHSPEKAMLLGGNDMWPIRWLQVLFPVIILPMAVYLLNRYLAVLGDIDFFRNPEGLFRFSAIMSLMVPASQSGAPASRLRNVWLCSTQSRQQLFNTLLSLINADSLLLVSLLFAMFTYAELNSSVHNGQLLATFVLAAGLFWFTTTFTAYLTLKSKSPLVVTLPLFACIVVQTAVSVLMHFQGAWLGWLIGALAIYVAFKGQQRIKNHLCYTLDMSRLRPYYFGGPRQQSNG